MVNARFAEINEKGNFANELEEACVWIEDIEFLFFRFIDFRIFLAVLAKIDF